MFDISKKSPLFDYFAPKGNIKGLLSIPHSGETIPEEFQAYIEGTDIDLMQDLDFRVHELVDIKSLNEEGIGVIKSNISRITVDLNRSPDKALFAWKNNSRGINIVTSSPDAETAKKLLLTFYSPYFEMLKAIIHQLENNTQKPSIIDLHSMPSKATAYHLNINPNQPKERPSFCISDRIGKTCEKEFIDKITQELKAQYPSTSNNMPYFGGYLTEFFNEQVPSGNNIQIEISRALYMNEEKIELCDEKTAKLNKDLTRALINQFDYFYRKYKN